MHRYIKKSPRELYKHSHNDTIMLTPSHLLLESRVGEALRFFLRGSVRLSFSLVFLSPSVADTSFGCTCTGSPVSAGEPSVKNIRTWDTVQGLPRQVQEEDWLSRMSSHTLAVLSCTSLLIQKGKTLQVLPRPCRSVHPFPQPQAPPAHTSLLYNCHVYWDGAFRCIEVDKIGVR